MRIFLTGPSGYIGTAVAKALKRRGHDIVGLARSQATIDKLVAGGVVHPVHGDLDHPHVLHEMVRDADAVIHCSAPSGPEQEAKALDVMLGAIGNDHECFIYTSGVWVYGDRGDAVVDEDAPLAPTPLVAWRPAEEAKVLAAAAEHHTRTVVIRPGMVYGDGGGIVGMMTRQAAAGPLEVVGSGANRWSMVRVDALAELYALAIEKSPRGRIYNATSAAPVPYVEIARAAARAAGGDGSVVHITLDDARAKMGPFADALALDLQVSSQRAADELGWTPHRPTVLEELSATTVV